MSNIKWQQVCCGEHGNQYAEHAMVGGGTVRFRGVAGQDTVDVCRFGADNRPIDQVNGVPAYVQMPLEQAGVLVAS
jgi:hypothetical protein